MESECDHVLLFDDLSFLMDYMDEYPDQAIILKEILSHLCPNSKQFSYEDCRMLKIDVDLYEYTDDPERLKKWENAKDSYIWKLYVEGRKQPKKYMSIDHDKECKGENCKQNMYHYKSMWMWLSDLYR